MSSLQSTPQSSTYVMPPRLAVSYRQTDYYDGKFVRIAESRRRSHVTSPKTSATSFQLPPPLREAYQQPVVSVSSTPQASDNRPMLPDRDPRSEKHVTSKSSRTKGKVVIVQQPVPVKFDNFDSMPRVNVGDVSTPPPTPTIERLPTPELDDLDMRPFCDCCMDVRVIRYCASCGTEMKTARH